MLVSPPESPAGEDRPITCISVIVPSFHEKIKSNKSFGCAAQVLRQLLQQLLRDATGKGISNIQWDDLAR